MNELQAGVAQLPLPPISRQTFMREKEPDVESIRLDSLKSHLTPIIAAIRLKQTHQKNSKFSIVWKRQEAEETNGDVGFQNALYCLGLVILPIAIVFGLCLLPLSSPNEGFAANYVYCFIYSPIWGVLQGG
jgi:hypothetical protein